MDAGPCTSFEVITLETPALGDRSYLAVADGWAVAVDIQRDIDRVERLIDERGLRLATVVETHIHNDYVTGGLALARRHRAEYVVPAGPRLAYTATRTEEDVLIPAGPFSLRAVSTPGHTDAHAAYSLSIGDDVAAFTGGSLLLGGAGRTDLLGIEHAESLARRQYWSIRRLARLLPADSVLYPTHGFGSFCVAGEATGGDSHLLAQMSLNPAFHLNEDEFVAHMLGSLGDYPSYYPLMAPRNVGGPTASDLTAPLAVDADTLVAKVEEDDRIQIVDVRTRESYAAAHIPGSFHVSATGPIATWIGWVLPIDTPFVIVADNDDEVARAQRELSLIGFDDLHCACVAPTSQTTASTTRGTFADLAEADTALVLDVRERAEWTRGHIPGAVHVPVHELPTADIDSLLTAGADVWVHCAIGHRAGLATSLLERRGLDVIWVDDDFAEAPQTLCHDLKCGTQCRSTTHAVSFST